MATPYQNSPNDKNDDNKAYCFFSSSFVLAFTRTRVDYTHAAVINSNISIDDQGIRAALTQIFVNQFKDINREYYRFFDLKVATSDLGI